MDESFTIRCNVHLQNRQDKLSFNAEFKRGNIVFMNIFVLWGSTAVVGKRTGTQIRRYFGKMPSIYFTLQYLIHKDLPHCFVFFFSFCHFLFFIVYYKHLHRCHNVDKQTQRCCSWFMVRASGVCETVAQVKELVTLLQSYEEIYFHQVCAVYLC